MLFTKHIVDPKRVATSADLATGPYPIGLTVEAFLDLFADVKSFEGSGFSIIDQSLSQAFNQVDAFAGLNNLNSATAGGMNFSSFAGASTRAVIPVGQLTAQGEEPTSLSVIPSTLVDYPVHFIGGMSGFVRIDFGKTRCFADLLYPYILIQFGTGMGNTSFGSIVGVVSFDVYGSIPIYGGPAVNGITLGFAGGSIRVKERYSSLRADVRSAAPNTRLTFAPNGPMSGLENYRSAYIGGARVEAQATPQNIVVTVPPNAKKRACPL